MNLTPDQNEALKMVDARNAKAALLDKIREKSTEKFALTEQRITLKTSDVHEVEYIKLPKEGGIEVYFKGIPHPRKGYPIEEAVEKINDAKKNLVAVLFGFKEMFSNNKIKTLIFLLLFRKQYETGVKYLILSLWKQLRMYHLQRRYYCNTSRELFRVFDKMREDTKNKENKNLFELTGNIIAMILEYDDAYRYRFQNVFGQLNKDALNKNTFKELKRIIEIGRKSEIVSASAKRKGGKKARVAGTWRAAGIVLTLVRFSPFRKRVTQFFKELNIEEIKLSVGDYYFAKQKPDFNWQKPSDYSSNHSKIMADENVAPDSVEETPAEEGKDDAEKEEEGE